MRSSGEKTSLKTDLTETSALMGKVSAEREVERSIPRVQFATDICVTKLSLLMKYIAVILTCDTYAEIQACNTTYIAWYQRLQSTTIADIASELELTTDQFALCLGLGWSPNVIRVEFGLEESLMVELSNAIGKMQLNEVLALMLVSQAAACDGTRITTTASGQEIAPGTLPTF